MNLPQGLEEIIDYAWPDALWVAAEAHADDTVTLWVLNIDCTYTEWLACLSLDQRWTLSPVRGPWHTAETDGNERIGQWRKLKGPAAPAEGSTPKLTDTPN